MSLWRFETIAVHAGLSAGERQRALAMPIYQSAAFAFDDVAHAAALFDGSAPGHVYSRLSNPTVRMLEDRIAALEGGTAAVATASGQAAVACALQTLCEAGDNIVSADALYGTTRNLLEGVLPSLGVETRFFPIQDLSGIGRLIDGRTRAIFCESLSNPSACVAPLDELAALAHAHGLPLIVDNTVATPYLCQPILHGADIVVHSLTKYAGGHGTTLAGAIVDAGRFAWAEHADRFPRFSLPDPAHHGIVFTEAAATFPFAARAAGVPLRNMGAVLSPLAAFLIAQGLETLPLRMERICYNALNIAEFLAQHPRVYSVRHAALDGCDPLGLAQRYLSGKGSGLVTFDMAGSLEEAARVHDAVRLFSRSVNIGDCKSLICHPASTTHRQLGATARLAAGVGDGTFRLSIGIEHIEDLLADLDRALVA